MLTHRLSRLAFKAEDLLGHFEGLKRADRLPALGELVDMAKSLHEKYTTHAAYLACLDGEAEYADWPRAVGHVEVGGRARVHDGEGAPGHIEIGRARERTSAEGGEGLRHVKVRDVASDRALAEEEGAACGTEERAADERSGDTALA